MTRKAPTEPRGPRASTVGKEDPAYYEALGRAIKVARAQFGLDRKDLATLANVSYAYLSDIETGRGRPGSRSLFSIAAALGRTPAELMHEAEVYRAQITGEPLPEGISPVRSWLESRGEGALSAPSPASIRELRNAWRERLATRESAARAELHEIVDGLSHEDVDALLAIARRLLRPAGPPVT